MLEGQEVNHFVGLLQLYRDAPYIIHVSGPPVLAFRCPSVAQLSVGGSPSGLLVRLPGSRDHRLKRGVVGGVVTRVATALAAFPWFDSVPTPKKRLSFLSHRRSVKGPATGPGGGAFVSSDRLEVGGHRFLLADGGRKRRRERAPPMQCPCIQDARRVSRLCV